MDLNALRTKATTNVEQQIEDAVGRAVGVIADAAEDSTRLASVRLHLIEEIAKLAHDIVTGTYTAAGQDALVRKEPLALGAGPSGTTPASSDRDTFKQVAAALGIDLDKFETLVLNSQEILRAAAPLDPSNRNDLAKAIAAQRVLSGQPGYEVKDDSTLTNTTPSGFVPIIDKFNGLEGRLKQPVLLAFGKIVDLEYGLNRDGTVVAPADPAAVNALQSVIDSIKGSLRDSRVGDGKVVQTDKLSSEAKSKLGIS